MRKMQEKGNEKKLYSADKAFLCPVLFTSLIKSFMINSDEKDLFTIFGEKFSS
jgi:hypothetical protein